MIQKVNRISMFILVSTMDLETPIEKTMDLETKRMSTTAQDIIGSSKVYDKLWFAITPISLYMHSILFKNEKKPMQGQIFCRFDWTGIGCKKSYCNGNKKINLDLRKLSKLTTYILIILYHFLTIIYMVYRQEYNTI